MNAQSTAALPSQAPETQVKRVKVMLMLWSLHGGGAERMASHLYRHLDLEKFDVCMALMTKQGPYLKSLDPSRIMSPEKEGSFFGFDHQGNRALFKPLHFLKSILAPFYMAKMMKDFRPQVVLSFCKGTSIATMAATYLYGRKKLRWIAREGNNTKAVIEDEVPNVFVGKILQALTYFCYQKTHRLLCISENLGRYLQQELSKDSSDRATIYNAVDLEFVREKAKEPIEYSTERGFMVAVGRLDRQKAFDVLLEAYSKSRSSEKLDLVILGKGPDLEKLQALAKRLGVQNRVHFQGWTDNPWAWISKSKLFVLSSRWEGFGNVVVEAMACSTPVVVTDCDFGPKEIVIHEDSGLVVPVDDIETMAKAIDRVLGDERLYEKFSSNALKRSQEFSIDKIVSEYQNLFLGEAKRLS